MKVVFPIILCMLASLAVLVILAPFGDAALAPTGPEPQSTQGGLPSDAVAAEAVMAAVLRPTLLPVPLPTPEPTEERKPEPIPPPILTPAPTPTSMPISTLTPMPEPEPTEEFLPADEGLLEDPPEPTPEPTPEPVLLVLPNDDLSSQPHYIEKYDTRYRTYMAANAWATARTAVALVNVGIDYGFYNNVNTVETPDNLLALCNKNHQLPRGYTPEGMRTVDGTSEKLRSDAADAYEQMSAAMMDETGLGLHIVSGYRGYQTQDSVYTRYVRRDGQAIADTYSARAGYSEHQTGLAVDITQKVPSGGLRRLRFEETPQYAWLIEHAHEYGFILRYPDGWTPVTGYLYEPWHWRYIGVEDAGRYHAGGYAVLEAYLGEMVIQEAGENVQ